MRWFTLVGSIGLASCSQLNGQSPDPFSRTGELIALSGGGSGATNACFTCHGLDGGGNGAGAPRLAGLGVGYIDRQLEAYANGRRQHAQMEYIARRLSYPERHAVAAYYAGMQPRFRAPASAPPASRLYVYGDPSRDLAPCASCHGLDGRGAGEGNPPLAGQPAAYLAGQLHAWRDSKRRSDPGNFMLEISRRLTEEEIRSVSAYAAALPAASRHPELPEAFPEERRDDPRSDASGPPPRVAVPIR